MRAISPAADDERFILSTKPISYNDPSTNIVLKSDSAYHLKSDDSASHYDVVSQLCWNCLHRSNPLP